MSSGYFLFSCYFRGWDRAKKMIAENPTLIWTSTSRHGHCAAYLVSVNGNVEMLKYMYETVVSFGSREEMQQLLKDTFEKESNEGYTPAHGAALLDNISCLEFLVAHCPSGSAILEKKNIFGYTPAHEAAQRELIEPLDFLVKQCPSGIGVLKVKNEAGKTPLEVASREVRNYFTPRKIREIGLERELELTRKRDNSGSLISLVFHIIEENTALLLQIN